MELSKLVVDIADAITAVDASGVPFKTFLPGVGPYGEPQLVRLVAKHLESITPYAGLVRTKRVPDLLIRDNWALEFKIARPYGNNGELAENWTVNLLHPYEGNVSALGDCIKLLALPNTERRAVIVVGYEHIPAKVNLDPLISSFEILAQQVMGIQLGNRIEETRSGLIHPVHQCCRIFAWEVVAHLA